MMLKIYLFLLVSSATCSAQIISKEFAIKQAVQNCSLIIEGRSEVAGTAFRGSNKMIYTPYQVTVSKVISGTLTQSKILLLVEGGQIEENGMGVSSYSAHGVSFLTGVNSIIFCSKSETSNLTDSYLIYEQVCYKANDEIMPVNYLSEFYKSKYDLLKDINSINN